MRASTMADGGPWPHRGATTGLGSHPLMRRRCACPLLAASSWKTVWGLHRHRRKMAALARAGGDGAAVLDYQDTWIRCGRRLLAARRLLCDFVGKARDTVME